MMEIKDPFPNESHNLTTISEVLQKVRFPRKALKFKTNRCQKSSSSWRGKKKQWGREKNWFDDALDVPPKMSYLNQSKPKKKKTCDNQ